LAWLRRIGRDEAGLPLGLLLFSPFLCVFVGLIWWVAHWLGLWGY
jgi:hypothetical protein